MRILVSYRAASRIRGWETGAMITRSFRRLGHEVDIYARQYESNGWVPIDDEFGWLTEQPTSVFDKEYDLHLWMECNDPDIQYMNLMALKCRMQAAWFFDISYYPGVVGLLAQRMNFDHVFCANDQFVRDDFWPDYTRSSYLPYAVDKELHFRPLNFPKKYDVGLVGSNRPVRRDLIQRLLNDDIDAHLLYGLFKAEYVDALSSCRVVINQNPSEGRGLLNMRHFEAQAAGAALLSGDIGFTPYYVPTYNSTNIIDQCQMVLDNYSEIAHTQQRAIEINETYDHRAKTIMETLYD